MRFKDEILENKSPDRINEIILPRRQCYYASPADWRDEILYFLLVDRFSDGHEKERPLLDRRRLNEIRMKASGGMSWNWSQWAQSGADRFQGGTIKGVQSKLDYLKKLGITAIWVSPIFKQRGHENTYHGYGVQDFLDVDPRFGNRSDLVELVEAAHLRGIRIILDIIINHSGCNWFYRDDAPGGPIKPVYTQDRYPFGSWRGDKGQPIEYIRGRDEGVWPKDLQNVECYTRAGCGNLGAGDINDPHAEHKRTDFEIFRHFELPTASTLSCLASCYKYWISLTDCDGFRIDTLRHVSPEVTRDFCSAIKEFAVNIGKKNFLLVGEIVLGGEFSEDVNLEIIERNLTCVLEIGEKRISLNNLAKGISHPWDYFFRQNSLGDEFLTFMRGLPNSQRVSILDDHDHVYGQKIRFSADAASDHQVVAGVAIQLLAEGIPCIYYGTEQAFSGPEPEERKWLPKWKESDRYLREAMFGPEHPRKTGREGLQPMPESIDPNLPGFGPFGTAGYHCFDESNSTFLRIAALTALRKDNPVLCHGRQYIRPISIFGWPFDLYGPGEIVAWSRILDDEEALCILNSHGTEVRGADVLVDASLNPEGSQLTVILNSAQSGSQLDRNNLDTEKIGAGIQAGAKIPVLRTADGKAFIKIRDVLPSEIVVLTNHPEKEEGSINPDE
jgi:glycosidase